MDQPLPYTATPCCCGHRACTAWHVWPVAARQGVSFTEREARLVARVLNEMAQADQREWTNMLVGPFDDINCDLADTPPLHVQLPPGPPFVQYLGFCKEDARVPDAYIWRPATDHSPAGWVRP